MNSKILKTITMGLLAAGLAHADYDDWSEHRDIVLNTSATGADVAEDVTNFPVLIRLTNDEASIMLSARPGGADIRFSKADDATPLPYEIDTWEPWGASIWVLVDTVYGDNATQKIRMHWGNPAANSESDGSAVFDTANGFVGVWHLGNAAGASPRPNSVDGAPTAAFRNALVTQQPVRGIVGMADSLAGGPGSDNNGDGDEDGNGHYIDLTGDGDAYEGYSDFTGGIHYSLWVNPNDDYTGFPRFLQMVDDTTYDAANSSATRIMFFYHSSGSLGIRTSGLNSGNGNTGPMDNHVGDWKLLAFSKGPGTDSVRIYVDGELFHTLPEIDDIPVSTRQYAWIGRSFSATDMYLSAKVDAPMMSKVSRSTAWNKLAFENQKAENSLADIGLGGDVTGGPYSDWSGHRTITLNTSESGADVSGDVADFPLLVRLTEAEALIINASQEDGADIRFSKTDDATPLPYHIESWDSTGAAIWVLVDLVEGDNATQAIRMHWNNPDAESESDGSAVFTDANGYKAVFHMNEASGDITDATANAITGSNVGTTTAPGIIGAGRNFGGTNADNSSSTEGRQAIDLGDPAELEFTGVITLSSWIRWDHVAPTGDGTHYRNIVQRDGSDPSAETFLRIGHTSGTADQAQYATGKYAPPDIFAQSPDQAYEYPDSAQWVHLAGVYDDDDEVWRLYRNGLEIGVSETSEDAILTGEASQWWIGRAQGQTNRYFSGDIDELRIAAATRSADYIKLSYESQKTLNSLVNIGTYIPPTVPDAPTGVTGTASTTINGAIAVSWTAPENNGGASITSYAVAGTPSGSCVVAAPALTCTVTGLTPDSSYTFTVSAFNSAGEGEASEASEAVVAPTSLLPGESFVIRMDGRGTPYSYRIPASAAAITERLTMTITDMLGKRIWSRTIHPAAGKSAELTWDGRTSKGMRVSAGMYVVRLNAVVNGESVEATRTGVRMRP